MFALGYNPTGTQTQLYTINRTTGVVTAIGAALTLNLGTTTSRIGFNFNPTTGFTLYPNPVEGEATLPRAGQAALTVSDALGRTVNQVTSGTLSGGAHALRWQSGVLKLGFYFVGLAINGQLANNQRIIVK